MELNWEKTADGSITLKHKLPSGAWESMHSLQGAIGETRYVYGSAVDLVFRRGWEPRFLVAGLGLGLIEFLVAEKALNTQTVEKVTLHSFENEATLREQFISFVTTGRGPEAYRQHEQKFSPGTRQVLQEWFKKGQWVVGDDISSTLSSSEKYTGLLYDLYASHAQPLFWSDDFLEHFLRTNAAGPSVFATYAATSTLKRVLKRNGFKLEARKGFQGKREMTLSWRESQPATKSIPSEKSGSFLQG